MRSSIDILLKFLRNGPNDTKPSLIILTLKMRQAITCSNDDPISWRIYASRDDPNALIIVTVENREETADEPKYHRGFQTRNGVEPYLLKFDL